MTTLGGLTPIIKELSGKLDLSESALKSLTDAAESFRKAAAAIESIPRLLQGMTEIAKVEAQEIVKLEAAIQHLRHSLVGGSSASQDIADADMEHEIIAAMQERGIGHERAEQDVRERALFSRMRW